MAGDFADAVLDGVFCQGCGEYLGEGGGFATFCPGCRPKRARKSAAKPAFHLNDKQGRESHARKEAERQRQVTACQCPQCGKRLRNERGRDQHVRDAHGGSNA